MAPGLRERRKQETRQAISDIATQMFADRGFDTVTIAEVAEAAGVAKMTVTNYFPRKEDLVFDRAEAVIRHLADVTIGLSSPAFARMILSSPALIGRVREMLDQREQALGDAIAAETGADGPQERLAAALLSSVHRVLSAEGSRRSLEGQPREQICAVLAGAATRAFDLLEPSLGGYGIRPQPA